MFREKRYRIYENLVGDVSHWEEALRDALPVDTTAELPSHLHSIVDDWKTGRKSLRTVAAINAYAREIGDSPEGSIVRTLTGLDATFNVLDDVIDTQNLTTETRIRLTVNAAFSSVLIAENLPPEARGEIGSLMREYFTALFQIPLVESRLFDEMKTAESDSNRVAAAVKVYSYRARDIDAFAQIPAFVGGLQSETRRRSLQDLRTYRARRLLFKDIHDVPRDLADDDMTPIVHLLRSPQGVDEIADIVERIYVKFQYTSQGNQQYGSLMRDRLPT